jgi:Family of unknown function (DUF695)
MAMSSHKDEWTLTEFCPDVSPERGFFRKNTAPEIAVGDPAYPYLVYLTFAYSPRDASGLPSESDDDVLFRIEEEELGDLMADALAVQIGAVTKNGIKDLLFYTRDAQEFLRRAEQFRTKYPQFEVGCEISKDPEWAQYGDLP